jgi:CheY-like chemotaxis protein
MAITQKENSDDEEVTDQPGVRYGGALKALGIAIGFGVLVVLVFAAQALSWREFLSVVAVGLLVCSASLLIGTLVGFLFGIPRSLEKLKPPNEDKRVGTDEKTSTEPPVETARYRPNTNLEDISDWLTKILVGVGLTQLGSIRAALRSIGQLIAPALGGFPSSEVFALGGLLYFSTCGFFIGFLWARLTLPRLYLEADLGRARRKGVEAGVKLGQEKFLDSTQRATKRAAENPERSADTELTRERIVLWVDDKPDKNTRERELMERLLALHFEIALTTDEALNEISSNGGRYSLVISDMVRPEGRAAGITLLQKLREMGFTRPVIFYTGSIRSGDEEIALSLGANGITTSPQRLLDLVSNALND